jgi:hypothetical protein
VSLQTRGGLQGSCAVLLQADYGGSGVLSVVDLGCSSDFGRGWWMST